MTILLRHRALWSGACQPRPGAPNHLRQVQSGILDAAKAQPLPPGSGLTHMAGGCSSNFISRDPVPQRHAAFARYLSYIKRDGTDRDGSRSRMYSQSDEEIGVRDFNARARNDPHQFRIIVSPEDSKADQKT
jgi:hypothetical protein